MKKILSVMISAAASLLLLCSCGENSGIKISAPHDFPVTVAGREIKRAPQKVISLSPSLTEIIYTLGSYAQLCGVSDDCNYPPEAEQKPAMGTTSMPKVQEITDAKPDIVLVSGPVPPAFADILEKHGITLLTIEAAHNIDELKSVYISVASVFAGETTGKANGENTYSQLMEKISSLGGGEKKTAVFIPVRGTVAFDGSFISDIMELAGAENVAAGPLPEGSDLAAYVASLNPDYIFCAEGLESTLAASLESTNAAKSGNIKGLSPALFERQGSRIYDAAAAMHGVMYPAPTEG